MRSLLALNHNDGSNALEHLQAAPYDMAIPRSWFGFFGNLQKMLDHAGIVFTDPVRAVARLQLGRALASAGDRMKARAAYQDFLTLWKEADSDIPLLKRTKAEYALLL